MSTDPKDVDRLFAEASERIEREYVPGRFDIPDVAEEARRAGFGEAPKTVMVSIAPYRYFVTTDDRGEREVDKAEFVSVERRAGFNNTMGQPLEPATSSFSATIMGRSFSGRTEYALAGVDLTERDEDW